MKILSSNLLTLLIVNTLTYQFGVEAKVETVASLCLFKTQCYFKRKASSTPFGSPSFVNVNSTHSEKYNSYAFFTDSKEAYTIDIMECGPTGYTLLIDNSKEYDVIQGENWSKSQVKNGIACERVTYNFEDWDKDEL